MRIRVPLLPKQYDFVTDVDTDFVAFIGGKGCVAADTEILTEEGLVRIADLTKPTRVLSWNEKNQQFQFSLTGGAFLKGVDYLYRISTSRGEFVASGHHRVFCADRKYRRVQDLELAHGLANLPDRLLKYYDYDQLRSHANVQHYSQIDEDFLYHYANEARQYGQQLLHDLNIDPNAVPSQDDVDISFHYALEMDAHQEQGQKHIHRGQSYEKFCSRVKNYVHLANPIVSSANRMLTLCAGHILAFHQATKLFLSTFLHHHTNELSPDGDLMVPEKQQVPFLNVDNAFSSSHSCSNATILSIKKTKVKYPYYDMQVLDTHNYVTKDGCIHHNSGKSYANAVKAIYLAALNVGHDGLIISPQHKNNRRTIIPELKKQLANMHIPYSFRWTPTPEFEIRFKNGISKIYLDTAENVSGLVGLNLAWVGVDEADILKHDDMEDLFDELISRIRAINAPNIQIYFTSTPEGHKWIYQFFIADMEDPKKRDQKLETKRVLYRAETDDNPFLPAGYADRMRENLPPHKQRAYIHGEFVPMDTAIVYDAYDRQLNFTDKTIETIKPSQILHIGVDFNIDQTCGIVSVIEDGIVFTIDEIVQAHNTDDLITQIKQRYPNRALFIYPDSSGKNQSTNASQTDIFKLQRAFGRARVCFHSKNPFIKDRVDGVNAMFYNGSKRRIFINPDTCPTLVSSLTRQTYDKSGNPDKSNNVDHPLDAFGYFIWFRFPIRGKAKLHIKN